METKSLFWEEDVRITSKDDNGNPSNGTRIYTANDGTKYTVRFRNGCLDGDSFTPEGKRLTQPAVEGTGHLEYWREGRLHRDDNMPAVITEGFSVKEWWENNKRIK